MDKVHLEEEDGSLREKRGKLFMFIYLFIFWSSAFHFPAAATARFTFSPCVFISRVTSFGNGDLHSAKAAMKDRLEQLKAVSAAVRFNLRR